MIRLMRVEIAKLIRRPRTYLGYAGVVLLVVPYLLAFHYGRPEEFLEHRVGSDFEVMGTFVNALFIARMVMEPPVLGFFVPLICSMVAGDMIAGEAAEGTLRALLVRPVRRGPVVTTKFLTAAIHCLAVTLFLGIASLGLGALIFGVGDLFVFDEGLYVIPLHEALLRLGAAYLSAVLGMITVSSFAFLVSTVVDNSSGAVFCAMMLLIVSGILGVIPYFESIQPYLFTTHMGIWRHFFEEQIPWNEVRTSALWLLGYTTACFVGAQVYFSRKDILS